LVTHIDVGDGWEPDEETGGLVRMVRAAPVMVGLWKPNGVAGREIEYELDAEETLVVLRGSGEVRVDDGEPIPAWSSRYSAARASPGSWTPSSASSGSTRESLDDAEDEPHARW